MPTSPLPSGIEPCASLLGLSHTTLYGVSAASKFKFFLASTVAAGNAEAVDRTSAIVSNPAVLLIFSMLFLCGDMTGGWKGWFTNRGYQRGAPIFSAGVGAAAEDDNLEKTAGGAVRGEEVLVAALEDDHLGLLLRTDGEGVVFLRDPFVAKFVGEIIEELLVFRWDEEGLTGFEILGGFAVATHGDGQRAEVVNAHLTRRQLARVVVDDVGGDGAAIGGA